MDASAFARRMFVEEAIDTVKSVGLMKKLFEGRQIEQLKDQHGEWRDLHFYGLLAEQYFALEHK